jgi:hypothetical protein
MSTHCQLSNSHLGLLYVAAMVLGADLLLLCWRFSDGQSVWVPALGAVAMLCTSFRVVLEATQREGVVEGDRGRRYEYSTATSGEHGG